MQKDAIQALRAQGYAVVIFSPDELGSHDPRDVEDDLTSHANTHWIDSHDES